MFLNCIHLVMCNCHFGVVCYVLQLCRLTPPSLLDDNYKYRMVYIGRKGYEDRLIVKSRKKQGNFLTKQGFTVH